MTITVSISVTVNGVAQSAEVEPRLLYGLLLLKAKERDAAQKHFEDLKVEFPKLLLPLQASRCQPAS